MPEVAIITLTLSIGPSSDGSWIPTQVAFMCGIYKYYYWSILDSLLIGYWHQVRSYGAKNMAVTMLFSRIKSFNGSNCASKRVDFTPLSETGMVWTYPGYGPQTLGNLDPFELRYACAYCHFQCLCCTFVAASCCH